jgi:hypothetical protein
MRKTLASATFLLLGAGAAALGANLKGSDTLEDVTKFMLANGFCPNTSGLVYTGGGSTDGEQAMTGTGPAPLDVPAQSAAPMSRALGNAVCTTKQGTAASAAGIFTCLDGLAIVSSSGSAPSCDLKYTPGSATDWRDVLRMVYAGAKASPDNTGMDCNSTARQTLVANWGNLFNGTCAGSVPCTTGLQHAFRRSDMSGTTDTFLSLLGLPARTANPFCNGVGITGTISLTNTTDFADNDPIRRTCAGTNGVTAAGEQVCSRPLPTSGASQNTLGLVQVVFVPETSATLTQAQIYPTAACTSGKFGWVSQPTGLACPYGKPATLGACLLPYQETPSGPNYACVNSRINRGFFLGATAPAGDGRVFNLVTRQTNGTILRDANNRRLLGSFYRIHTTQPIAGGTGTCQHASSTGQIGCLVAASPCSIGFAGREAAAQPGAVALRVRGVAPTTADIQALITSPATAYPIARKLYYNSVVNPDIAGLGTAGTLAFRQAQAALKTCFATPALAKTACETYGFVEAPGGPKCEDFNEQTACGAASNVNACP